MKTDPERADAATAPRPAARRKPAPHEDARPKRQPPYAVVLHNDPINGFEFVIGVLMKVFRYGSGKAFWLTFKAHLSGRSIVWSGSLEVAELKVEQLHAAGPDPKMVDRGAKPLKATLEALP